ncbi:unnamed protein product [Caenorhabditis auriculariae]|uniref:DH domain-containing protein n=1 Tax=Caenorhabditis auriculariae TaxID=2777116 RepID=A0A8S1H7T4_9PELO|nr:unnamed protein product [Caenorhabditis auriculariae]
MMLAKDEFDCLVFNSSSEPNPAPGSWQWSDTLPYKVQAYCEYDMSRRCPYKSKSAINAIQELYDSERKYVTYLAVIDQLFVKKLFESNNFSKKQLRTLFGEISPILQTNEILLLSLRSKPIHEAFQRLLPFLKFYTNYAAQYPVALKTYAELMKRESFRTAVGEIEAHYLCDGNRLPALLIMPVQRLPRYITILERLIESLGRKSSEEKDVLIEVVGELRKLMDNVQHCMIQHSHGERLLQIQESFGLNGQIFEPGRRIIKEGILYKREIMGGSTFHERVFYLFNDVLLYGKKRLAAGGVGPLSRSRYEPCCMMSLRHCEIDHNDIDGTIFIKCDEVRLVVTADSFNTVTTWFDVISTAIRRSKALRTSLRKDRDTRRVTYFDRSLWQKGKNVLKSVYSSDARDTVGRVLSRRHPIHQNEEEQAFLKGSLSGVLNARKRRNGFDDENEEPETPPKRPHQDFTLEPLKPLIEVRKAVAPAPAPVVADVDEVDRRPRNFGEVRANLAMDQIRKLSYQQSTLYDTDEEAEESFDATAPKKREEPWWVKESAPPGISHQRTQSSIFSRCSLM